MAEVKWKGGGIPRAIVKKGKDETGRGSRDPFRSEGCEEKKSSSSSLSNQAAAGRRLELKGSTSQPHLLPFVFATVGLTMASSNNDIQALTTSYQSLSTQLQTLIEARQRLDSQLSENTQVAKEFSGLTPNNQVYKLMGPVLMKVDQEEAKSNVDKRIEYIQGEM